ncbi:DUF2974 domain-containing protein [bacterium]|nr:DUF2974 domain-containing protein [bacterium]MBQ9246927.1 DUF2974 domain-containing protein [bacterium]
MNYINKYYETVELCNGAHNKKDVQGWKTLYEFGITSSNIDFDYRVFKKNDKIVIAFSGTDMDRINDLKNDVNIMFRYNNIPSQYGDAERLYRKVKLKYPNAKIEFTGYSLGASIANLLSHRTGLPSYALAPIGSKFIVNSYPQYFKFNDSNIVTYGRMKDLLFAENLLIGNQSGKIIILPNISEIKNIAENHYLHCFRKEEIYQAKPYKKEILPENKYINFKNKNTVGNMYSSQIFSPMSFINDTLKSGFKMLDNVGKSTNNIYQKSIYNGLGSKNINNGKYINNVTRYARFTKTNPNDFDNIPEIN